jgi:2-oxoglutarate ferredoxin oxidoreductase subunit gamma
MSPLPKLCRSLISMNEKSYKKYIGELAEGGFLILNTSRVRSEPKREDIDVLKIPADDMALEIGNIKVANIILLGAYLGYSKAMDPSLFLKSLEKKFAKKPEAMEANRKALETGAKMGEEAASK